MSLISLKKIIRIGVIVANDMEDMEFIIPVDIWRRAKFVVDVIVCEVKNTITLNYSTLKVSAFFNLKHTNLSQYDALFFPGGPGYKSFLSPAMSDKDTSESKLHVAIKKFYSDPQKWLIGICASPIALLCILDSNKDSDFKFTCYEDDMLIGDFKSHWIDDKVVIDKNNFVTAQTAACSFDLSFSIIELLTDLEYAQEVAKTIKFEYKGIKQFNNFLN